jgi:LysR family transcriptional regulator, glycine cleavage system transcriptional activator
MRRLPPLNSIKAFEAAARYESFSRAAAELCVTHGAVSKQIDLLEKWLGVKLFRRTARGVVPTEACRAYQAEIGTALDRIAAATLSVNQRGDPDSLDINAPPTFTIKWLVPRLSKFQIRNPSLEIRLSTKRGDASTALQDAGIVIRRGPDNWRGVSSRPFLKEAITPVCAPKLIHRKVLKTPADLARQVWLHADARPTDWKTWLKVADIPDVTPLRSLRFDHSSLALEAAADGMGIAMGPLSMIRNELDIKLLVMPFPKLVATTPEYYSICSHANAENPLIVKFRSWLESEGMAFKR